MNKPTLPRFGDLSEQIDPSLLPWLDQPEIDDRRLTPEQKQWRDKGVVVLEKFLPDDLMDAYINRRSQEGLAGWLYGHPYIDVPELRQLALYRPLTSIMRDLMGEEMMLHLALTGWITSERAWHQDDYLNPPFVNGWYCAVWMALDTVDPDSGPFEYVPESHRWPLLRGEKVRSFMEQSEFAVRDEMGINQWPKLSERFVESAVESEIRRRGQPIVPFLGHRGDVLIWHGRLMHRGRKANVPLMLRRSLITHYSGVNHRFDMPMRAVEGESTYAVFPTAA